MTRQRTFLGAVVGVLALALTSLGIGGDIASGQQSGQRKQSPGQRTPEKKKKSDDEEHGRLKGWRFTLPKGGDPVKGRAVFMKLECFSCHEVKGETFPPPSPGGTIGPELSAMAAHHPPEFFAESIINPGAVIEKGRGYEGPDGTSKMPSFNEDITVTDLLDLVAYLVNLKPPAASASPTPSAPPATGREHRH